MRQRNLAAAKPFDLHPVLEFIETNSEKRSLKLGLRNDHLQGALQPSRAVSVTCIVRVLIGDPCYTLISSIDQ